MAKRVNRTIRVGACTVSIKRNVAWGEYIVTTKTPVKRWNGTYHTEDKSDARSTAAHQIRTLRRAGVCR